MLNLKNIGSILYISANCKNKDFLKTYYLITVLIPRRILGSLCNDLQHIGKKKCFSHLSNINKLKCSYSLRSPKIYQMKNYNLCNVLEFWIDINIAISG